MSARTYTPAQGPVRIYPTHGRPLDISVFRGQPWRPSGTSACCIVFAVTWQSHSGRTFWAALHDFDEFTQKHLLAECARHDRGAFA